MLGTNSGNGGLGCIGCHGWGEYGSLGEDGPELLSAGERLRYDWFLRWMRHPARILSGTSMPNYFSSFEPATAAAQINDLWAALSAGESLALPEGFKSEEALLGSEARPQPIGRAIVIRWDMPEATPSAIAVGMPGGISYCFDAGESRLRYAWSGGFLDMSRTLFAKTNKATGLTETAQVVGDIFYRPDGFPFRINSLDRVPQRKYLGYRIVDGYPRFHYRADGVDIYERVLPAANGRGIKREFEIGEVRQPVWFLSGMPEGVAIRSSLGKIENGRLRAPQGSNVRFEITVERGAAN
jgi:hypothetical protein